MNNEVKNDNCEKINDVKIDNCEKNNEKVNKNFAHALKYGIAVLSIVSFITTSNGLSNIMPDSSKYIPYLISFGIQVMVLVIGTELWTLINNTKIKIKKTESEAFDDKTLKRNITIKKIVIVLSRVFLVFAYLFSVSFSSFFSYVYLANNSYSEVQAVDYNIEIESFINEEINNLKNINELEGTVIKNKIRSYMPQLQGMYNNIELFYENSGDEILNDSQLEKFSTESLTVSFDVQQIIADNNLSDSQINSLREIEQTLNAAAGTYNDQYRIYSRIFDEITEGLSDQNITYRIEEIELSISYLESLQATISNLSDRNNIINNALQQSITNAKINIQGLVNAFKMLKQVCEEIDLSAKIEDGEIDIKKISEIIYSVGEIDDSELEGVVKIIKKLLSKYQEITEYDNQDEELLSNLSSCVDYIGEYQKYLALKEDINIYETEVLRQVYVIEKETTTTDVAVESSTKQDTKKETKVDSVASTETQVASTTESTEMQVDDTTESTESTSDNTTTTKEINVTNVNKAVWNNIRRINLGDFISLLKSLPDINTLITLMENEGDDVYIDVLSKYEDYQDETLNEAYLLNRNTLEEISDVEVAIDYFTSDFNTMAIFCIVLSLFLDTTPFFVGTYLYFIKLKEDNKSV